jgi:hypothetical protein
MVIALTLQPLPNLEYDTTESHESQKKSGLRCETVARRLVGN